jgi:hypothetical protein
MSSQYIKGSWLSVDVPVGVGTLGEVERLGCVREGVAVGLLRRFGSTTSCFDSEIGTVE